MLERRRFAGAFTAGACLVFACACVAMLSGEQGGISAWGEERVELAGGRGFGGGAAGQEIAKAQAWADAEAGKLVVGLDHVAVTGAGGRAPTEFLASKPAAAPAGEHSGARAEKAVRGDDAPRPARALPVAKVMYEEPAEPVKVPAPLLRAVAAQAHAARPVPAAQRPSAHAAAPAAEGTGLHWPNQLAVMDKLAAPLSGSAVDAAKAALDAPLT